MKDFEDSAHADLTDIMALSTFFLNGKGNNGVYINSMGTVLFTIAFV